MLTRLVIWGRTWSSRGTILGFTAGFLIAGCATRGTVRKDADVLTEAPWKYEKAGFDDDDGSFDALDPRIADSEKENTIIFHQDGTGTSQFARRSKTGNPDALPFLWSFANDSTFFFEDQYYKVRVLTPQRLEIYTDQRLGNTNTRYTIILRR